MNNILLVQMFSNFVQMIYVRSSTDFSFLPHLTKWQKLNKKSSEITCPNKWEQSKPISSGNFFFLHWCCEFCLIGIMAKAHLNRLPSYSRMGSSKFIVSEKRLNHSLHVKQKQKLSMVVVCFCLMKTKWEIYVKVFTKITSK
jgi:hypothetical protein